MKGILTGLQRVGRGVRTLWKKNTVLCIAAVLALLSMLAVPVDAHYAAYPDWKTLCSLFVTLAVVCALKDIHFFAILARHIVQRTGNSRMAALALVYITFLGSMLIANDMALITFLPLGYLVFSAGGHPKEVATVFILQNIAANLGGMLTPFGNPQNLYLYTRYHIPTGEFMTVLAPCFALAVLLVTLCCLLIPRYSLRITPTQCQTLPRGRTTLYLGLFLGAILMVFRLLPPLWVLLAVVGVLLVADRKALREVDYGLLGTFFCFFVFAGNMGRVAAVRDFFSQLLGKSTLFTAILSCQVISNVPSAILLSQFTDNYVPLLLGVNVGGTGTLIASLASLITFREFCTHYPAYTRTYLRRFTLLNLLFLLPLAALAWLCVVYWQ